MRESLRLEQHSREEEQLTHAEMIKELQALISSERDHKEALQLQVCNSCPMNMITLLMWTPQAKIGGLLWSAKYM